MVISLMSSIIITLYGDFSDVIDYNNSVWWFQYPDLPQEQLTAQVQSVIRQMITSQISMQQNMQKRQVSLGTQ